MRSRSAAMVAAALAALLAVAVVLGAGGGPGRVRERRRRACCGSAGPQDPTSLNPFVGLDEEDYTSGRSTGTCWSTSAPRTSRPAPGIAESWEVSEDQQDGHLQARPGREVVRRQADHLRRRQVVARDARRATATLFTELHAATSPRSRRPTTQTVVIHTRRPDARIVGGLFIYILPEHIWGKVPLDELTGPYQPELPLVGSGPYIVTEYERGRIIRMERNPEFRGEAPSLRRDPVHQVRHPGRGRAGARAGRDRHGRSRSRPATSSGSASEPNIETVQQRRSPSYTRARLQPLPGGALPGREVQPGGPGLDGAPGDRLRDRPRAHQRDRRPRHLVRRPTGSCRRSTSRSTRCPSRTTRFDPELANQMLDDAGWVDQRRRRRATKDGEELSFDLYVRSESPSDIQAAKLIAEMAAEIGVEFNVQVVSTGQAHRAHGPEGRRQAGAGLRHLHLGLGRRPLRPELPAQPLHSPTRSAASRTRSTRTPSTTGCSRSRPGVRRRGAQGDHPGDGRDHPGGPALRRPHRGPEPAGLPHRPARERRARLPGARPATCSASRSPTSRCSRSRPAEGAGGSSDGGGQSAGLDRRDRGGRLSASAAAFCSARRRTARREREPLELDGVSAPGDERALAGRQGRGGAADARLRHRLQLLPLPGHGRPDHPARPAAAGRPRRRSSSCRPTTGSTSRSAASSSTTSATR